MGFIFLWQTCIFGFALSMMPGVVFAQMPFLVALEGSWQGLSTRQDFQNGQGQQSMDMRTNFTVTRIDLQHWTSVFETTSAMGAIETKTTHYQLNGDGQIVIGNGLFNLGEVTTSGGFYTLDYAEFRNEVYPQRRQVDVYQQIKLSRDGTLTGFSKTLMNGAPLRHDSFRLRRI